MQGEAQEPKGFSTRGFIPHYDLGSVPQFITWRLSDSLPKTLLEKWKAELAEEEDEASKKRELWRRIEGHLDSGSGECTLADREAASIVQASFFHFHEERYRLHAWVIMTNHVHLLLTPFAGYPLNGIIRSLKGYSSRSIQEKLGRKGRLWQPDYFDRVMGDRERFERTAKYIEWNPVKAGLCLDPREWVFSSANPAYSALVDRN